MGFINKGVNNFITINVCRGLSSKLFFGASKTKNEVVNYTKGLFWTGKLIRVTAESMFLLTSKKDGQIW